MMAAAMVALTACGQQEAPTTTAEAPAALKSGITMEYMDTSVRPGDDFFSYVNGKWIAETEIPADKASYGGFGILADEAQEDVRAIIEQSASGSFAAGSDEQKVGDLYKSYLDMETRNARSVTPLEPELERIAAIADHDQLAVYFAAAGRRGYPVPVKIGQVADFKDPNYYMIYAWQNGLGLPDREYYFKDDDASVAIREKYVEHIETMFELAGFEDAAAAATEIMDLETRIAAAHITKEAARDWPSNYNKVALDKLNEVMPNFNWQGYIDEAGIADINGLVLMMTSYFEGLDTIIAETPIDSWQTYLQWVALNTRADALNQALDDQNFPPEAKARMLELVGNLIKAYEKSIMELDWMSDETKAQALDKLHKFRPKIGYPDVWRDYSALEIKADDLFGNIERATVAQYERELARQGGPVDRDEWAMNPQTVNAYYMPPLNEIVFPAAILQPPFFNMEADDAVNYGAIGAVIGHEIGHGFDDKGSTFDGDGVMRNWWTETDRTEFEARTARLVDQYNEYAPFEDLNVNGEFTLGENIGDLGGISIGLLAYKMSLDGKEPPVIDGFTGIQRVFLGYGQVWRNKYRDAALRQQIMTDPHSPSKYRANGAVRNVPEFYEAFDVAQGDALYLPPQERVKIW
jgi:putative endopeptidase